MKREQEKVLEKGIHAKGEKKKGLQVIQRKTGTGPVHGVISHCDTWTHTHTHKPHDK